MNWDMKIISKTAVQNSSSILQKSGIVNILNCTVVIAILLRQSISLIFSQNLKFILKDR